MVFTETAFPEVIPNCLFFLQLPIFMCNRFGVAEPKSETTNSGEASVKDQSEAMTKIRISKDPDALPGLDVSNLEHLKFEFVSSFELRVSNFRSRLMGDVQIREDGEERISFKARAFFTAKP